MKITIEKLEELGACKSGADWFRDTHPEGIEHDELVKQLVATGRQDWAYWLISRLLTPEQTATWADYSATIAADAAADAAAVYVVTAVAYAATAADYSARYAARYAADGYAGTAAAHAVNAARYADTAAAACGDKVRALVIDKGLDLIKEQK